MNDIEIGTVVKILNDVRPSHIGAVGRVVFIKDRTIIIKTLGGNMFVKTNLHSIIKNRLGA